MNSHDKSVKFKDKNFNHHNIEASKTNSNYKTIKKHEKVPKANINMDVDALELSVDIFDEPKYTKREDLGVDQSALLNQRIIDSKNLVCNRLSKDVSRHAQPIFDNLQFSKQASKSMKPFPNYYLEYKGANDMNALLKSKMALENLNDSIKPFTTSLAVTNIQKDNNSTTFVDHHLHIDQNIGNNMRNNVEGGEKIIRHIGKIQETFKSIEDEYKRSRKKQKSCRTEMKIINMNDKANAIKRKNVLISNNDNINQDIKKEKIKITTTHSLANENSSKTKKDIKTIVKSRTIQEHEIDNNKVSNITTQLLKNHDGMWNIEIL